MQFRVPEDTIAFLRQRGLEPNAAARESLERLVRSLQFEEALRDIRKIPIRPFDVAKAVREARDEAESRN